MEVLAWASGFLRRLLAGVALMIAGALLAAVFKEGLVAAVASLLVIFGGLLIIEAARR